MEIEKPGLKLWHFSKTRTLQLHQPKDLRSVR